MSNEGFQHVSVAVRRLIAIAAVERARRMGRTREAAEAIREAREATTEALRVEVGQ